MKKILITGSNSYVGTSFSKYLIVNYPNDYQVEEISVKGNEWKSHDFSKYDVIFHVAGIAHIKETRSNKHLYYEVNRDLAYEIAKKAKNENIKQFIFMSSMSIYGVKEGKINKEFPAFPKSAYGKSKLEAENIIKKLETNNFNVSILRPPMIYGPNAIGNYSKLSAFAKKTPIFPNIKNKRSMIFITNLAIYIKNVIDYNLGGIHIPQNNDYVSTTDLVKEISKVSGNKIYFTKIFNPIIYIFIKVPIINKVFGNLFYESTNRLKYINFKESIKISEDKNG